MHRSVLLFLLGAAFSLLSLDTVNAESQAAPLRPWKSSSSIQSPPACAPAYQQVTTRYAPTSAGPNLYCQCGSNGQVCNCTPEMCALGLCPPGCCCRSGGNSCPCCKRGNCLCRQCPPGCQCASCRAKRGQGRLMPVRNVTPRYRGEQTAQAPTTYATMRPTFPK